jgi:aerobic C4-dicarboxylate transport protein
VARWTGDLDVARMQAHLDHPTPQETDEPEELHEAVDAHMHVAADRIHS